MAILAGLMIFPAAFSVGVSPDSGPSLIFYHPSARVSAGFFGCSRVGLCAFDFVLCPFVAGCNNVAHLVARGKHCFLLRRAAPHAQKKQQPIVTGGTLHCWAVLFALVGRNEQLEHCRTFFVRCVRLCYRTDILTHWRFSHLYFPRLGCTAQCG